MPNGELSVLENKIKKLVNQKKKSKNEEWKRIIFQIISKKRNERQSYEKKKIYYDRKGWEKTGINDNNQAN